MRQGEGRGESGKLKELEKQKKIVSINVIFLIPCV